MPQHVPPNLGIPILSGYPRIFFQLAEIASPLAGLLALRLVNLMHLLVPWRWKITWRWSVWSNRFRFKTPWNQQIAAVSDILHMLLMENSHPVEMVHAEVKLTVRTSTKIGGWKTILSFSEGLFPGTILVLGSVVTWSFCWADLFWFQKTTTLMTFPTVRGGKPWWQVYMIWSTMITPIRPYIHPPPLLTNFA